MTTLSLPDRMRSDRVSVLLIGAGGNGSAMLAGLARLHVAMVELGHPGGLDVTLADPDRVSESNVGRQMFSPADVGRLKCEALISRVNLFYGLNWKAVPQAIGERHHHTPHADLVITCTDTARSRREIAKNFRNSSAFWLDLGNEARHGQVVLGTFRTRELQFIPPLPQPEGGVSLMESTLRNVPPPAPKLPNVLDLFPRIAAKDYAESNAPSCSMEESLRRQDLFINQTVATFALDLLWDWFRRGRITCHGAFINLESKQVRPLPIDPKLWARMAASAPKPKAKAGAKKNARRKSCQADTKSKRSRKPTRSRK